MPDNKCPTCGAGMTGRWERLTRGLAGSLIKLYKASGETAGRVHLQKSGLFTKSEYTNFYRMKYFGLVEPVPTRAGCYQLTPHGRRFVAGLVRVPANVFVFRNEVDKTKRDPEGRLVNITDLVNEPAAKWIRAEQWRELKAIPSDPAQSELPLDGVPAASPYSDGKTRFYTFRTIDRHELANGTILDKNIVVRVKSDGNPRDRIFDVFGTRWGMEYKNPPKMEYFSRGIYNLLPDDRLKTSTE